MVSIRTIRLLAIFAAFVLLMMSFQSYLGKDRPFSRRNDFAHYYISAALYHQGENPYSVELATLYESYGFEPQRMIHRATNPPALVQLTEPLVFFSPSMAYQVWTIFQILAYIAALLLSMRIFAFSASPFERFFLLLVGVINCPFIAHLRYGQTQALMTLLIVAGWFLFSREKRSSAAFLWGVATSLKIFTWPLALIAFKHGGKKTAPWFALGFAALQIPFLLRQGVLPFLDYVTLSVPYVQETVVRFIGNISLTGCALFTSQILLGHQKLYSTLLPIMSTVSFLLLCASVVYVLRRKASSLHYDTACMMALCIVLAPTAWNHYLPLLYPGFLLMLSSVARIKDGAVWYLLLIVCLLVVGSTVGWIKSDDLLISLVSTWWGFAGICFYLFLLLRLQHVTSSEGR